MYSVNTAKCEDPHRHDRGTGRRRTRHRRTTGDLRDERAKTEERAVALRKEVVTLNEQVATLTWRTFRQTQPAQLTTDW